MDNNNVQSTPAPFEGWSGFGSIAPAPEVYFDQAEVERLMAALNRVYPDRQYIAPYPDKRILGLKYGQLLVLRYEMIERPGEEARRGRVIGRRRYQLPTFDMAGKPVLTLADLLGRELSLAPFRR